MAKAQLAATIDAIRGHIGSLNFWLAGTSTNVAGRPARPWLQTPAQTRAQAAWTNMLKAWSHTLTLADRQAWSAFGTAHPTNTKCGGTAPLSGFQAFTRTNGALQRNGHPIHITPPADFVATAPGSATLAWTTTPAPALTINGATPPDSNEFVIIRGTGPKFPGYQTAGHHTLKLTTIPALVPGPWDFTFWWSFHFGTITTGQQIIATIQYVNASNGAKSPTAKATLLVP